MRARSMPGTDFCEPGVGAAPSLAPTSALLPAVSAGSPGLWALPCATHPYGAAGLSLVPNPQQPCCRLVPSPPDPLFPPPTMLMVRFAGRAQTAPRALHPNPGHFGILRAAPAALAPDAMLRPQVPTPR